MKWKDHKNYLLALLLLNLAFNFADRSVLGLLLQDIKIDLSLSDTQLGFLSGLAFALFYSVMGIPIARWADRGNRVVIISVTAALGSVMVASCGLAGSFVQLLMIRVGVAIGEAGCIPASNSLVADNFTRTERPRAVALYLLGSSLSVVIGFFLGGWLSELYGWRLTFVLLGLPGVVVATLIALTLREPRLSRPSQKAIGKLVCGSPPPLDSKESSSLQPSLKAVVMTLSTNRTFRHLLICFSVLYFFNYGVWKWQPAFFIRSYGLGTKELGIWFAVIYGLGGLLGTYVGGELAARYAANDERLQLRVMAAVIAVFGLISAGVYVSHGQYLAFGLIAMGIVGLSTVTGPLFATVQTLVAPRMRAMSIAIIYLFANLIGMGLGPLTVGMLSDALRLWAGEESLRYALLALCPGYLWAGWHLWQGSKSVAGDLKALERDRHLDAAEKTVVAIS